MKNIAQHPTRHGSWAVALLYLLCLGACDRQDPLGPNPNNPATLPLPAADFELRALDHERGFSPDSSYVFEGVERGGKFYFGTDKLDEMVLNVTPDNRIRLNVDSREPGFDGVNAKSSNRCVNIVPDGSDHDSFLLEWVAEGQSVITLWNGEGDTRREKHFVVTSRKEIPLEGIAFRYNGTVYKFQFENDEGTEGGRSYALLQPWRNNESNLDYLPTFELVGPVPLNATPVLLYLEQNFTAYIPDTDNTDGYKKFKKTSVLDYNQRLYQGYRWFPEYKKIDKIVGYKFVREAPLEQQIEWQQKYLDSFLKVNPADLRERRIKLWGNDSHSYKCNFTFYLRSGDAHIRTNEENQSASLDFEYIFRTNITH